MCGSHQRLGLGRRSESELRLASPFHAKGGQKQQQKGIYPCPFPVGIRRKKKIYDGRKSRPLAVSGAPAVVRRRSWWPRRAYRGEDGQEEEGGGEEGRRRQGQGEGEDQPDPLPGGPAFRVRPCPMHACLALFSSAALFAAPGGRRRDRQQPGLCARRSWAPQGW